MQNQCAAQKYSPEIKPMDRYLKKIHLHYSMMYCIIILISLALSISEILSLSHPLQIFNSKIMSL